MPKLTKPIKISSLARAGCKLRIPKATMTKPIKIAFLARAKVKKNA